jgi:hypothetical protein
MTRSRGIILTVLVANTPGIGARLPTYRLITRNSAMMAAWLVVIE